MHCPHLSSDSLPRTQDLAAKGLREIAQEKRTALTTRPRRIVLSHDRSCNLSCPSCRTKLILARKEEQARLNAMADTVLLPLARDAERLRITASGDPFGSAHFRYVMKKLSKRDFPKLLLEIQTNGVLFDREAWEELELAGHVGTVAISIDAATEATYAIVRRGGSFERLLSNLEFIATLREAREIPFMRLDFVVQNLNFHEMPDMPALAARFAFDRVKFQMIRNWRTYSPEEFAHHDIGSPFNPNYQAFLDVLRRPELGGSQVEFWGMDRALRDAGVR
jgi:MoaA/NifB/PqqE/SkfB family radical SAM enzyme